MSFIFFHCLSLNEPGFYCLDPQQGPRVDPEMVQKIDGWRLITHQKCMSPLAGYSMEQNVKDVNKYLIYDNNEVAGLSFSTLSKNEMNQYSYDDCSEINLVLDDIQESIFYNSFSTFHDILPFYLKVCSEIFNPHSILCRNYMIITSMPISTTSN